MEIIHETVTVAATELTPFELPPRYDRHAEIRSRMRGRTLQTALVVTELVQIVQERSDGDAVEERERRRRFRRRSA